MTLPGGGEKASLHNSSLNATDAQGIFVTAGPSIGQSFYE